MPNNDPKIVVIGGGTGSFTLLSALKHHTKNITAIVNMADDGGSTGVLRDELGVLPPGDVRQCLVALSEYPKIRELFNYRFEEGGLSGHSFGNLFLTALEKMTGNFAIAVEEASKVLDIVGRVEPVTLDKVTLVMQGSNGNTTRGEFQIGNADFGPEIRPEMLLDPVPTLNPKAERAIRDADIVIIAPGNIYGSLAPTLIVPGVSEALRKTKAKKVYVCNLVTKPGQTDNFTVDDFAKEVERFGHFTLDYVFHNNTDPDPSLLARYAKEGEYWVKAGEYPGTYELVRGDFMSNHFVAMNSGLSDPIAASRTLIRHDSEKIANAIISSVL
jgi:uncharacterized cofD-like protein